MRDGIRERWQMSAFNEIIGSADEECSTMIKVSLYASLKNTCRTAGSDKLNALYTYEYSEGPD